jgi:hypothetical protein
LNNTYLRWRIYGFLSPILINLYNTFFKKNNSKNKPGNNSLTLVFDIDKCYLDALKVSGLISQSTKLQRLDEGKHDISIYNHTSLGKLNNPYGFMHGMLFWKQISFYNNIL